MSMPRRSTQLTATAHSTYSVAMSEIAFTRSTLLVPSFKTIVNLFFTLQAFIDRGRRIFKIDDVFTTGFNHQNDKNLGTLIFS